MNPADPRPVRRRKSHSIAIGLLIGAGVLLLGLSWAAFDLFGVEDTSQLGELSWILFAAGICLILAGLAGSIVIAIQQRTRRLEQHSEPGEQE
jgi:predicted acyltransferase